MAKKVETDPIIDELKKLLIDGKITMGIDKAISGLKKGTVSRVYVASNFPEDKKEDIARYAELSGAEVISLKYLNTELGTICKKVFPVSVLSVPR